MSERCEVTGKSFELSAPEAAAYRRFDLPYPKLAPTERLRRQLAFRSAGQFYWRENAGGGPRIFSAYSPRAPFPVMDVESWRADPARTATVASELDESTDLFVHLHRLWTSVARPSAVFERCSNSVAIQECFDCAEGYYLLDCHRVHASLYSVGLRDSGECIDCLSSLHLSHCYECVECRNCTALRFGVNCVQCKESWFLKDCEDCRDCLLCVGLKGARFCIQNQQLPEAEYWRALEKWQLHSREMLMLAKTRFSDLIREHSGETPVVEKNSMMHGCIHCAECEDVWFSSDLVRAIACIEGSGFGENIRDCAQFVGVGYNAANVVNCINCVDDVSDLTYCFHCSASEHLLGCVGLRNSEYCILNRQYSKNEYFALRERIVAGMKRRVTWGRFFPAQFAEFAYNASMAGELFKLNRVQGEMLGYPWDSTDESVRPSQLLAGGDAGSDVSERYGEVPPFVDVDAIEELTGEIFLCEISGRPFRLTRAELEQYSRLGLPPPTRAFEQRHRERLALMNHSISA